MPGRFISVAYRAAGSLAVWDGGGLAELRGKRAPSRGRPPGGLRGPVGPFSKASRRRLLRSVAKLRLDVPLPTFVTLTYPASFPDGWTAKRDARAFLKRLQRVYPAIYGIWRLEFQDRGAPHLHFIVWGLPFVSWRWLAGHWTEAATAGEGVDRAEWMQACSKIERAHSSKGVIGYAAKYAAKVSPEAGPLHVGRRWGWFGQASAAWAPVLEVAIESWRLFYHVRRAMRRLARRRRVGGRMSGLTIFSAAPVALVRLL